jgi:nucleoside-diphosphate-sugar epimerase
MIVGNGMLAKAFGYLSENDDFIVFASGVSNSKESNPANYQKEVDLLTTYISTNSILIYFSTCSVYDPEMANSPYIQHKRRVESFIATNFKKYWILRLPNVVGFSNNNFTMCNFFYHALRENKSFTLQENAYRYFIDVQDVAVTVKKIVSDQKLKNGVYDLLYPHALRVKTLVELFEQLLNSKGRYDLSAEGGGAYSVYLAPELKQYADFLSIDKEEYFSNLVKKYYSPVKI